MRYSELGETNGLHVFYRGQAERIADTASKDDFLEVVQRFIWSDGVFETDDDPLYVFNNYRLVWKLEKVATHTGIVFSPHGEMCVEEMRAMLVYSTRDKLMTEWVLTRTRELMADELGI